MAREQLNVRLSKTTKSRVIKDRIRNCKTNDIVVEVALNHFFSAFGSDQRAKQYAAHDHKPYARA